MNLAFDVAKFYDEQYGADSHREVRNIIIGLGDEEKGFWFEVLSNLGRDKERNVGN